MGKLLNLAGQRFDRWTVIRRDDSHKGDKARWICVCDCGESRSVIGYNLKNGISKSCGCLSAEIARDTKTIHGLSKTSEYVAWEQMRQRCGNKSHKSYKDWGGRGISVCERWANNFDLFIKDMGFKPSKGHSLDRIDNDGNYEPSNCRWATRAEQNANRRNCAKYKTKPVANKTTF